MILWQLRLSIKPVNRVGERTPALATAPGLQASALGERALGNVAVWPHRTSDPNDGAADARVAQARRGCIRR
jgi:hypothetical protein